MFHNSSTFDYLVDSVFLWADNLLTFFVEHLIDQKVSSYPQSRQRDILFNCPINGIQNVNKKICC